ncbi:MAG: hypothetical protein ACFCAD_22940 [Pleurocapsa sp.]
MSEITKTEIRQKLGNITQLQELLFGEQTREINLKFDSYGDRLSHLESNYQKLQLVLDERFEELENKLVQQINLATNSLEKKIHYLNLTSKEEHQKIKADLDFISQQSSDRIDHLQGSIKQQNNNLKVEINQSRAALDEEMNLLKQQITDRLNSSLAELSTGKVSRNDLAEVLFELCLKLKEPDIALAIIEGEEADYQTDEKLPEEQNQ